MMAQIEGLIMYYISFSNVKELRRIYEDVMTK